jgi:hypothetical protein
MNMYATRAANAIASLFFIIRPRRRPSSVAAQRPASAAARSAVRCMLLLGAPRPVRHALTIIGLILMEIGMALFR